MARIVSIFQFTGRVGSAVGSKGKGGKVLLRQYQPSVTNPRTAAQMCQRAKMKLAAQVAGMLGEVGRAALLANGNRKTDRGLLIKRLLQNIKVDAGGTKATLNYDLNLVDNPSYARGLSLAITNDNDVFTATFTGTEGNAVAKCILVHDITNGSWRHASALNTNDAISIAKSANERNSAIEVFAYGIVLMPKTSEGLNSLGQTGADRTGYVVDLNKVSATNFDFSPSLSAALSVDANGSTEASNGSSGSGSVTPGISETPTVEAPVIRGTTPFEESTEVTITGPNGAEIRYTVDGSQPTAQSALYSGALRLTDTATVKAIAIKDGVSSSVATKTFSKGSNDDEGGGFNTGE